MRTKGWTALLLGFMVVVCCSCASHEASGKSGEGGVYTRYNLHYISEKGVNRASYANWTDWSGHALLPYNSKVRAESSRTRVRFTTDSGLDILLEINPSRTGMPAAEYVDLITSPTPVAYEGLSDVDRQGIQAGKALVGMSKQGVKIALGYPAAHRTPSLEENRWSYWKGRYDSYIVEFDGSGKVARIVD